MGSVKIPFIEVSRLLIDFCNNRLSALLFCDPPLCNSLHVDINGFSISFILHLLAAAKAVCVLSPAWYSIVLQLHYSVFYMVLSPDVYLLYCLSQWRLRMAPSMDLMCIFVSFYFEGQ